eukprot:jgi/Tetstr1/428434/TSEL_018448.t1
MPEHIWPALHAFRTSIEASVGLEVRFDMEATRHEAPADIEWPELNGHHGTPVLNVTLESPRYVHACMRGKAEELHEEGAGIRRMATVRDALFIGWMNDILPKLLTRNSDTSTSTSAL